MFLPFFDNLRTAGVPVSLREFLSFLEGMKAGLATYDVDAFYFLARTIMVKDERHLDKFDRAFAASFEGLEKIPDEAVLNAVDIPGDWLQKLAEKHLTEEEKAEIDALGGFDKLMETLKKRLEEQKGRHQGGSKWVGTAGTSPFGAYGYNPEGVRIGQNESRHQRAVKVWDKREFRNLDDTVELGTRNIKVALKRLRRWARDGAADSFLISAAQWIRISKWLKNCSVRQNLNSSISNISTSTTASTKECGKTTGDAGTHKHPHGTCCEPTGLITNAFSWATPACHPTKSHSVVEPMSIGTKSRARFGWHEHAINGPTTCGSIR